MFVVVTRLNNSDTHDDYYETSGSIGTFTEQILVAVNTPCFYSGGPWLESRAGHRLAWQGISFLWFP